MEEFDDVDDFMKVVFSKFSQEVNKDITDDVFLFIEHDKDLKKEYDRIVKLTHYDGTVNKRIGVLVKIHFGLTNEDEDGIGHHPKSALINSYQIYKKR